MDTFPPESGYDEVQSLHSSVKPKKPKKAKVKKPVTKKAAKPKTKKKVVKAKRKPVKKSKARPARPVVRTERLDMRLSKAEKAKVGRIAKKLKRTLTSVVYEAIENLK